MNDIMLTIAFVLMFIAGFMTGITITARIVSKKITGSIRVNDSDPEEPPYIFAVFNKDISEVLKQKYIVLMVDVPDTNSQK